MDNIQFDIVNQDLNPTFLFSCQVDRKESENNYHKHDFIEIGIILKGKGIYHLNDEYVPVKEGDVLFLRFAKDNPKVPKDVYRPPLKLSSFEAKYFVGLTDVSFCNMRENQIELKDGSNVLHTSGKMRREIFQLCEKMEKENTERKPGSYFMLKAYLTQLLLHIVREEIEPVPAMKGREFESTGKNYVAAQIADYLDEHYAEKISLDQIAENMYLSPYYISKIFKSEIGESPIHYLIRVRLEHAKELLEQKEDFGVAEIAEKVGYDDAYHFSKLFKKTYGMSPLKYRNRKG